MEWKLIIEFDNPQILIFNHQCSSKEKYKAQSSSKRRREGFKDITTILDTNNYLMEIKVYNNNMFTWIKIIF